MNERERRWQWWKQRWWRWWIAVCDRGESEETILTRLAKISG